MCELPTVYSCDRPKARKEHICFECHGIISIGETYHNHHGIWDGEGRTYKVCNDCETLREELTKRYDLDGEDVIAFGELYEMVFDGNERTVDDLERYLAIKEKRKAETLRWMIEKLAKVKKYAITHDPKDLY